MNPLAHVTQTLLVLARSHRGIPTPHAPVSAGIRAQLMHATQIFLGILGTQVNLEAQKQTEVSLQTYTYALARKCCTQTNKKCIKMHKAWTTKASMWAMNLLCFETKAQLKQKQDQRERKRASELKLQAKCCMFDLTERYFQNHIQKFQPSGHNYLISKLRISSFAILSMSLTLTQGGQM